MSDENYVVQVMNMSNGNMLIVRHNPSDIFDGWSDVGVLKFDDESGVTIESFMPEIKAPGSNVNINDDFVVMSYEPAQNILDAYNEYIEQSGR